jgi:hypothetical protein
VNELALPETDAATLGLVASVQDACMRREQTEIPTQHLLHAGMYARTITMPPGTILVGTLIKIPTTVIMVGTARVFMGMEWVKVEGYGVLPASAQRKQVFVSESAFIITMIFPTNATTVREAEDEFTSEGDLLLSRRQQNNAVLITGEQ